MGVVSLCINSVTCSPGACVCVRVSERGRAFWWGERLGKRDGEGAALSAGALSLHLFLGSGKFPRGLVCSREGVYRA